MAPGSIAPGSIAPGAHTKAAPQLARRRTVTSVLLALVLAAIATSLCVGDSFVSMPNVVKVLTGHFVPGASFVINELRLPRVINAALVGVAFGISGTVFQTLLRNVLASPDVIGVTAGASASAVFAITILGASGALISGLALTGALIAAGGMYALAYRGGLSGYRLVLIGLGIAALLQAVVAYLLTRATMTDVQSSLIWLTGSLNSSLWNQVPMLAGSIIVLVPLALLLARPLSVLQLGDDSASGLGVSTEKTRLALILVAVALAAVATAAAGPVGFVALLSGPLAKRLTKAPGGALIPSALVGALIVLVSDFAGQHLLGVRLPVGIVTGAIGAPYLLFLLATSNKRGANA
jgi:iron complex transport system permease protein